MKWQQNKGSELSEEAGETDMLSSSSGSATRCFYPLAGSERLFPGVSEQWAGSCSREVDSRRVLR